MNYNISLRRRVSRKFYDFFLPVFLFRSDGEVYEKGEGHCGTLIEEEIYLIGSLISLIRVKLPL